MKKNVLLIAAALLLFLGNQTITAQAKIKKESQSINVESVESIAKKKTQDLVRPLGLSKKQQDQVYAIFLKTEQKMSRTKAGEDAKGEKDLKAKLDKYVMSSIKEILNEEQFKKYLEVTKAL